MYDYDDEDWPAAVNIPACPAAAAATLVRFRSASVKDCVSTQENRQERRVRTCFLLPLNLGNDGLNLLKC